MFVARSQRFFLAGLVAAAMAAPAFAQENAKEIMAKDAAGLVQVVKDPASPVFAKAKALPAAGGGRRQGRHPRLDSALGR